MYTVGHQATVLTAAIGGVVIATISAKARGMPPTPETRRASV